MNLPRIGNRMSRGFRLEAPESGIQSKIISYRSGSQHRALFE